LPRIGAGAARDYCLRLPCEGDVASLIVVGEEPIAGLEQIVFQTPGRKFHFFALKVSVFVNHVVEHGFGAVLEDHVEEGLGFIALNEGNRDDVFLGFHVCFLPQKNPLEYRPKQVVSSDYYIATSGKKKKKIHVDGTDCAMRRKPPYPIPPLIANAETAPPHRTAATAA
jgi:hypothetical protein